MVGHRVEHPVALEDLALVGEVDGRHLELLEREVLPDVELGPVADREHPHALAAADATVVDVPQLGTLVLRIPAAEVVAEGEDPLLRAGALLVAAGATERGVEAVLLDRVEQRRRLQAVAGRAWPVSSATRPASIDSCTDATTSRSPSSATRRSRNSITSGKLWPVSTCMSGKGKRPGRNAFSARRSSTIESLPPLNSSTGLASSAATSRMTWIASDSSSSRWVRRRVIRAPAPARRDPSHAASAATGTRRRQP